MKLSLRFLVCVLSIMCSVVLSINDASDILTTAFLVYSGILSFEMLTKFNVNHRYKSLMDISGVFIWSYVYITMPWFIMIVPLMLCFWLLVDPDLSWSYV